jgi:UDP-N-acetylglucosamine transferase subunit ALG13
MIFVTVGTHEQQFDRLIKEIDDLVKNGIIKDEVFIQIGFSNYKPKYCEWERLISYAEMQNKIRNAEIIITHGGPSSFLNVLQYEKTPIVVPRLEKYDEHVNDHQLLFLNSVIRRGYDVIKVEEVEELEKEILNYNNNETVFISNNDQFNKALSDILSSL